MPSSNTSFHTSKLGWSQKHDVIVVGPVVSGTRLFFTPSQNRECHLRQSNYMRLIPPAGNNTFFHPSRHRNKGKHAEVRKNCKPTTASYCCADCRQ
ncbi:uncharacterized protein Bfra_007312 [Botrytis fragariae]|uniref:Uncharacterized protein n=1 Tax=Botrytis fragariae TaxID=1964551 RepID=A0A8H6AIW2_9HELO|nr:uncharacterized protein Bfra_007312 [Botrytis fragariae]KAF5868116.1 hypothetical protein Bfra_007312 [Botrytis fragariae]